MNDIDEPIERLEKAKKSCGSIGVAALDEAITTLQEMQRYIVHLQESCETHCKRIAELEDDVRYIDSKNTEKRKRIAELEDKLIKQTNVIQVGLDENERLDAALAELRDKTSSKL